MNIVAFLTGGALYCMSPWERMPPPVPLSLQP